MPYNVQVVCSKTAKLVQVDMCLHRQHRHRLLPPLWRVKFKHAVNVVRICVCGVCVCVCVCVCVLCVCECVCVV